MIFCWSKVLVLILLHVGSIVKSSMLGHVAKVNKIITMVTGHGARDYVGYGNYCGLGGSGPVLDPIDECCKAHDDCYGDIQWTIGDFCNVYSTSFSYNMNLQTERVGCSTEIDLCRRDVCLCDQELAACLGNNDIYYDPSLRQHHFSEFVQYIMGK